MYTYREKNVHLSRKNLRLMFLLIYYIKIIFYIYKLLFIYTLLLTIIKIDNKFRNRFERNLAQQR